MRLSLAQKIRKGEDQYVLLSVVWRKIGKVGREDGKGRRKAEEAERGVRLPRCLGLWAENAELYSHFVDLPRGQFPCEFIKYIPSMTYISSIVIVIIVVSWMMVNGKGHEENGRLLMEISLSRVVALRNPVECCNG